MQTTPRRRRRIWANLSGILAIILVLGGVAGYGHHTLTRTPPAAAATLSLDAALTGTARGTVPWPAEGSGAFSAVGFEGTLAHFGSSDPQPIASITKTITALILLDEKPLTPGESGPSITMTEADGALFWQVIAEDGSSAPVFPGQELTQKQMMQALMLPSANNYAIMLTNWAFGSQEAFLERAAQWLAEHELTGTHLADSAGRDSGSVSTPADLIEIARMAIEHPVLAEIVRTREVNLPGLGTIKNTNRLLGEDGIIGIKTGTTDEAGACLLFAAERIVDGVPVTVLGVILGQSKHSQLFDAVRSVVQSADDGFRAVPIAAKGETLARYRAPWGAETRVAAPRELRVVSWADRPVAVTLDAPGLPADAAPASDAGELIVTPEGAEPIRVPLVTSAPLAGPDVLWRLTNPFS